MQRLLVLAALTSACVPPYTGDEATGSTSSSPELTTTSTPDPTTSDIFAKLDIPYPDAPSACSERLIVPACLLGDLPGQGASCPAVPSEIYEVCDITVPQAPLAFRPVLWDCQCGQPNDLVLTDLDADGIDDVAAACSGQQPRVAVWFGGERPSACPQLHPVAARPFTLAAADVDLDGHLDLITASVYGDTLSVLRGLGGRQFAPQIIDDAASDPSPEALDAVDANSDGVTDLVVRTRTTAEVLLGDGAGGFLGGDPLQFDDVCEQTHVADLDGDARVDLAVLCQGAFGWYRGDGEGFPGALKPFAEPILLAFTLADLDADGHLDLLLAREAGLFVGFGDGAGTFTPSQPVGPGATYPHWIEAAELDGEPGREIALQVGGNAQRTLLFRGDVKQGYTLAAEVDHVAEVRHPEIGDINGDGRGDLVWTQQVIQTDIQTRSFLQDSGVFFMESAP